MPSLEGSVESIVFRNEDNHYTVARFRPNDSGRLFRDDLTTIVGMLPGVHVGELLSVEGEWEKDPKYGRQLHITSFTQRLPASKEGITRYLGSGLIKGLHLFLQSHDVSMNLATRIYKQYGQESIKVVRENPYKLAQDKIGIGFRRADDIAVKLGLPLDSIERIVTGLKYVLTEAANEDGHCYLPENELIRRASEILQAPNELISTAMEQLRGDRDVFVEPPLPVQVDVSTWVTDDQEPLNDWSETEEETPQQRIYFGPFWHAENGSARILRTLLRSQSKLPPVSQHHWDAVFNYLAEKRNMLLTEKQRAAVQMAYNSKVSILTGGPGTGKSTSIRALLMVLRKRKIEVALAAPTGRAAKRLTEATGADGFQAKTLHRLLEYAPHDNTYQRNEENPLPYRFVIVDEVSMVDILLFYHLLKALPPDAHLLLVGDADQLPSVGPGNVLRDLLRSEAIPTVR